MSVPTIECRNLVFYQTCQKSPSGCQLKDALRAAVANFSPAEAVAVIGEIEQNTYFQLCPTFQSLIKEAKLVNQDRKTIIR